MRDVRQFIKSLEDTGDIVHQKQITPEPTDTAHTLYQKLLRLEVEVFKEAWPMLESGNFKRIRQEKTAGTFHKKSDLAKIQGFLHDDEVLYQSIKVLRALTTNNTDEAAYLNFDGKKYRVQVSVKGE